MKLGNAAVWTKCGESSKRKLSKKAEHGIKVVQIFNPVFVSVEVENFPSLVQKLTGHASTWDMGTPPDVSAVASSIFDSRNCSSRSCNESAAGHLARGAAAKTYDIEVLNQSPASYSATCDITSCCDGTWHMPGCGKWAARYRKYDPSDIRGLVHRNIGGCGSCDTRVMHAYSDGACRNTALDAHQRMIACINGSKVKECQTQEEPGGTGSWKDSGVPFSYRISSESLSPSVELQASSSRSSSALYGVKFKLSNNSVTDDILEALASSDHTLPDIAMFPPLLHPPAFFDTMDMQRT